MKLPEVRPQGNECSDDVTEGNLLTATTSLLSEWGIESVWMVYTTSLNLSDLCGESEMR